MAVQLGYTQGLLWVTIVMLFANPWAEMKTEACPKMVIINEVPVNCSLMSANKCSACVSPFRKLCIYSFDSKKQKTILASGPNATCSTRDNKNFIHKVMRDDTTYNISLSETSLTLYIARNWTCRPSYGHFSNRSSGRNVSSCTGDMILRPAVVCGNMSIYDEDICKETKTPDGYFLLTAYKDNENSSSCVTCTNPVSRPSLNVSLSAVADTTGLVSSDGTVNASVATAVMENMASVLSQLGSESSAALDFGEIKGVVQRLNNTKLTFGYSETGKDMLLVSNLNALKKPLDWSVEIPLEAVNQSQSANNGAGLAAILRFPKFARDAKNSTILNANVYGISMAAEIINLKDRIKIQFRNDNTFQQNAGNVRCSSWNGAGNQPKWTEAGCETVERNSTITCKCSHLTFFAILMSPAPTNGSITDSDLSSLTYISYIGCGLSMFFLGVALFMHFLLRKAKSSQAVQILMQLFLALFLLNLTFLSNEWVANTGSHVGCIIIATLMHYFMLSTFSWFALQAFHLYLQLIKMSNPKTYKHYMLKMCIPAWVCPAVIVIVLASLDKYTLLTITTDTGYKANMCWIWDKTVHYVVNIGYYGLVFIFTLGIFIALVQRIVMARKMKVKDNKTPSTSNNLLIILSLMALLGLTWGVAFFSYGPMVIPSYYIFCVLNAFQGFFLFIYYYRNSKVLGEDVTSENSLKSTSSCSQTTTSNIYVE